MLNKEMNNEQRNLERCQKEIDNLQEQIDSLNALVSDLRDQLTAKENEISELKGSICWKITTPFRVIGNEIISTMKKTYLTRCALDAAYILKTKGIKELGIACLRFMQRSKDSKDAGRSNTCGSANNKDGYNPFDSEYQDNMIFDGTTDIKMLAFYLPQYHTFPENDEWWGKGFTEWVNVKNGDARFSGHYQPRVPHKDIGYYSLENIDTLKKQAKLAKEHGIYGFCFYYYWFSGKRLMEKPVDMLLEHPEIDLPFCLCWANENWTRAWDGMNKNVLIAQEYSEQDDENFILDLKKYIDDSRYIRINGKPLIIVYNPGQIPDCKKSFEKWRECARECGIGEILIWTCQTANNTAEILKITDCIDAEVEFPPHNMWLDSLAVKDVELNGKSAFLYNYQVLVDYLVDKLNKKEQTKVPLHHSCMMAWDNAARRKNAWFTYYAFSLKSFYKWVVAIAKDARERFSEEERFVFINAWNEWGEGTYLDPDEKYGYANINTVTKALYNIPLKNDLKIVNKTDNAEKADNFNKKIAIQVHMYYLETLNETIQNMNYMPYEFDCYVSTDTSEKKEIIEKKLEQDCKCRKYVVQIFENRGRDVAPFICQMKPVIDQYDYICHIHSKVTKTGEYGNEWRTYNFKHLFGGTNYLKRMFRIFEEDSRVGIIMPETFPVLELQAEWGGNLEGVKALLKRLSCEETTGLPQDPVFPVGNMFWAKKEAVLPIFKSNIEQNDFPEEKGQTNATIAHQIERAWVYIARSQGYTYQKIFNNIHTIPSLKRKKRLGIFVHYDKENIISKTDIETIQAYGKVLDEIVFVTNSILTPAEIDKIRNDCKLIIQRENKGLDFGAWKDALLEIGRTEIQKYDQVALFNNSCFSPLWNIDEMFAKMDEKSLDFWGDMLFPYSSDGTYIGKDCIPEHLQSFLTVYNNNVLKSNVFWDFWEKMPVYNNYIDVVANCETQFTKILSDAGFKYEPYILESYYINQYLINYSIPYTKPTALVLLGNPLVKKKCYMYMDEIEKIKLEFLMSVLKDGLMNNAK